MCWAGPCRRSTGVGPDDLNLATLVERIASGHVKEVILAVNATVDGQTTAHYVTDLISHLSVKTTRLAHGVPVGRRTRLSRRRHARRGDPEPHGFLSRRFARKDLYALRISLLSKIVILIKR